VGFPRVGVVVISRDLYVSAVSIPKGIQSYVTETGLVGAYCLKKKINTPSQPRQRI